MQSNSHSFWNGQIRLFYLNLIKLQQMQSPLKDQNSQSLIRINPKFGHKLAPIIPTKFTSISPPKQNDMKIYAEELQSSEASKIHSPSYKTMPIYMVSKVKHSLALRPSKKEQEGDGKRREEMLARGKLVGNFSEDVTLQSEIEFVGNFDGVFERDWDELNDHYVYYFQGSIKNIKTSRHQSPNPLNFSGFFKGIFLPTNLDFRDRALETYHQKLTPQQEKDCDSKLFKTTAVELKEYFVPAFIRINVNKICQINLSKSSAQIYALLLIDIVLNDQLVDILEKQWDKQRNKPESKIHKLKLNVDFNRNAPMVLPFYDTDTFPQTDDESEYEWDDVWNGIAFQAIWDPDNKRMKYRIQTLYNTQIDNSHSIFYAPFNLNILRLIINLHSIKVNKTCKLNFSCCDLQDFNSYEDYTPYTYFNNLRQEEPASNLMERLAKHVDRITKINRSALTEQGEFKIADNRMYLYPYHKRVFKNKNSMNSDFSWMLGLASRSKLLSVPQVRGVKEGYKAAEKGDTEIYKMQQWQFVHIEIPIYKYAVIDMIGIFVPIIILSIISLFIFQQENGLDSAGNTELSKRIASGLSLMIAYVALIPVVRENLPPTPAVTLVQILIYLSILPNLLAIISVFVLGSIPYTDFFATYRPFVDPLFVVSFCISCGSFLLLTILIIAFVCKDYTMNFTINKMSFSPINRICSPNFTKYMQEISNHRKELTVERRSLFENEQSDATFY